MPSHSVLPASVTALDPLTLHEAVRRHPDSTEVLQRLLDQGVDIDGRDELGLGMTALYTAAANAHGLAIRALLTAGATVDAPDTLRRTPLYAAAQRGHADGVDTLLAAGADPTVQPLSGPSILDAARQRLTRPDVGENDRRTVQRLEAWLLAAALDGPSPQPSPERFPRPAVRARL